MMLALLPFVSLFPQSICNKRNPKNVFRKAESTNTNSQLGIRKGKSAKRNQQGGISMVEFSTRNQQRGIRKRGISKYLKEDTPIELLETFCKII